MVQKSVFTLTRGSQGQNLEAGPKFAIKELWNLRHHFSTLLSLLENQSEIKQTLRFLSLKCFLKASYWQELMGELSDYSQVIISVVHWQ